MKKNETVSKTAGYIAISIRIAISVIMYILIGCGIGVLMEKFGNFTDGQMLLMPIILAALIIIPEVMSCDHYVDYVKRHMR